MSDQKSFLQIAVFGSRIVHEGRFFKMAAPLRNQNRQILRDLLLFDEHIDDELLLLLLENEEDRESTYDPTWPRLDIEDLTREQCMKYFRFDQEDNGYLGLKLGLPHRFTLPSRNVVSGQEARCMVLRRLSYPNRLFDHERFFGRPVSTLSLAINTTVNILYENHTQRLSNLQQPWITDRLQTYADSIRFVKNAPLTNCFAFVDGTVRPICRPTIFQRVCYNRHKRLHAIKLQSLVAPDGMILNLTGPLEGRRHDCALLRLSQLLTQLEDLPQRDRNGLRFSVLRILHTP